LLIQNATIRPGSILNRQGGSEFNRRRQAMELMVSINTITGEQRFRPAQPVGGEGLHDQVAVQRGGQQLHSAA
jgi:hypothetical protein